ncbi:MAG: hypothetical protein HRT90_07410 [Candidatus Margulisbacteria bacterium]|nr:hypothetical protein [Candidatus Margulisiibacteriota bacterium]
MVKINRSISTALIIMILSTITYGEKEGTGLTAISHLESGKEYERVLVFPPESKNELPQHMFLEPSANTIVITAKNYEFKEEVAQFSEFKNIYPVYWVVWNAMLLANLLYK